MKRGDRTVLAVSAVLAVAAVAAVAFSLLVLDRRPPPPQASADSTSSLLVVTWAPSLCKVEPSNSGCRSGHVDKLGQSFMLHGLWPQPSTEQYCDVPKRTPDKARSPVPLPADLKASLQEMMSDSAVMTTHEWYAHGTCSGVAPPEYFGIAAQLAEQAGAVLEPVFARSAGGRLTSRSVREAFDARFGSGAGARVSLSCRDARGQGSVVYEVRLSLPPVVALEKSSALADALAAGPTVAPGCSQASVPDSR
jgi:ribonuclease T2